jgi:hypothetical protein
MSLKKQIHKHRLECIFLFDICVGFVSTFLHKIVIIRNKLAQFTNICEKRHCMTLH